MVISAFSKREIGQPDFAAAANASNLPLSAPGTCAVTSRWILLMVQPSANFSNVTVAVVSILLAASPAPYNCPESAIEKQPACAAAINSSGFVPTPFSNLVANEYCVCFSTPLSVEIVPLPSFNPPVHTADAFRSM